MKRNIILITATLAVSLLWTGCRKSTVVQTTTTAPTAPVELKLKWPAGRHMVHNFELKQANEITVPGMPAQQKQDMNLNQKFDVSVLKELEGGRHELELEFLSARMVLKVGDTVKMDTDSATSGTGDGSAFGKLAGAKLRFLLGGSNQVEKVEGMENLKARLGSADGNDSSSMMNSMLDEQYFRQIMDHSRGLPGKAVQPGDAWPVQLEIAMGQLGVMVMDCTYNLEGWEKRNGRYCARIGIDGTIKGKPGQDMTINGMKLAIDGGKITGSTLFDLDVGMFVDTTMNNDIKMTMTVPVPKQKNARNMPKSATISLALNQVITIKLESVN
jgi:hypothetical protein